MESINIPFNKWKVGLLFVGSLFYNCVGIGMLFTMFFPLGLLLFVISAWYTRLAWRRFTGVIPGLLMDSEGIKNNSQWLSLGNVAWKDVKMIKTGRVFFFYKVINVELHDPEAALSKETNILKRLGLLWRKATLRSYIEIQPRLLSKSHHELSKIISEIDLDNPNFMDLSVHLID